MVKPGSLYRVYISTLYGAPKDKYCLLACLNPKPRLLLISSELPEFIKNNKHLLDSQIKIDSKRHNFLHKDSYIDCLEPYGFPNDFEQHINMDKTRILCDLADDVLINVRTALAESRTISVKQIDWMLEELPKPDESRY